MQKKINNILEINNNQLVKKLKNISLDSVGPNKRMIICKS